MSKETETLTFNLERRIAAGWPGIWVRTVEPEHAFEEIGTMCRTHEWKLFTWNTVEGTRELRFINNEPRFGKSASLEVSGTAVEDAIVAIRSLAGGRNAESPPMLLVIEGAQEGQTPFFVQQMLDAMYEGKSKGIHYLFMSHLVRIPAMWASRVAIVKHPLPTRAQLAEILRGCLSEPLSEEKTEAVLAAASGMTRMEAENVFAQALIDHEDLQPHHISHEKRRLLESGNQAIEPYDGDETFADVGGLDALKQYLLAVLKPKKKPFLAKPRGILLLGVPGTGKSLIAKALGNEVAREALEFHMSRLRGGIQGQTEQWTEEALDKIDRMSPCIVFIDEMEKALSGLQSSGATDGGVTARQIGTVLKWMQNHTSDAYVIATCNDIRVILRDMPELLRRGRFDRIFFIDFPCPEAKEAIWRIHLKKYGFVPKNVTLAKKLTTPEGAEWALSDKSKLLLPKTEDWTGAEIESCCAEADMLGLPIADVGKYLVTMQKTAGEAITAVRDWARGRAYSAEYPGWYEGEEAHEKKRQAWYSGDGGPRRTVRRIDPSKN